MSQRHFVQVTGFSDVERHAINTVFRLSELHDIHYSLWEPTGSQPPEMALVDGESYEAMLYVDTLAANPAIKLIWVGADPPAGAWRVMQRPLNWSDVIREMDIAFTPLQLDFDITQQDTVIPTDIDVDLSEAFEGGLDIDLDAIPVGNTRPPDLKRGLIVNVTPEERLYVRSKLALSYITDLIEVAGSVPALDLLRLSQFDVVVMDLDGLDVPPWPLVRQMAHLKPAPVIILISSRAGWLTRLRARLAGAHGCLQKPMHPGELSELLLVV